MHEKCEQFGCLKTEPASEEALGFGIRARRSEEYGPNFAEA